MNYGVHRLASGKPRGAPVAIGEVPSYWVSVGKIITEDRAVRRSFPRGAHRADAMRALTLHAPVFSKHACTVAARRSRTRLCVIEARKSRVQAAHDCTFHEPELIETPLLPGNRQDVATLAP